MKYREGKKESDSLWDALQLKSLTTLQTNNKPKRRQTVWFTRWNMGGGSKNLILCLNYNFLCSYIHFWTYKFSYFQNKLQTINKTVLAWVMGALVPLSWFWLICLKAPGTWPLKQRWNAPLSHLSPFSKLPKHLMSKSLRTGFWMLI
jgi:hypothetical protein